MKCFKGAAILPKRVGLPNTRPAQSRRSSSSQYSGPESGMAAAGSSIAVTTGGTPYGASHWAAEDNARAVDDNEAGLCRALGARVARVAQRLGSDR